MTPERLNKWLMERTVFSPIQGRSRSETKRAIAARDEMLGERNARAKSGAARSAPRLTPAQTLRHPAAQSVLDLHFMALPPHAQQHQAQTEQAQRKREQKAVFEHLIRQVAQIDGYAEPAQHREHAPTNRRAPEHQRQVDAGVRQLAPFVVRIVQAQTAPEHDGAKQIEPERFEQRMGQ